MVVMFAEAFTCRAWGNDVCFKRGAWVMLRRADEQKTNENTCHGLILNMMHARRQDDILDEPVYPPDTAP